MDNNQKMENKNHYCDIKSSLMTQQPANMVKMPSNMAQPHIIKKSSYMIQNSDEFSPTMTMKEVTRCYEVISFMKLSTIYICSLMKMINTIKCQISISIPKI